MISTAVSASSPSAPRSTPPDAPSTSIHIAVRRWPSSAKYPSSVTAGTAPPRSPARTRCGRAVEPRPSAAGRPSWVSRTWNVTSPGASLRARCSYRIGSSANFAANRLYVYGFASNAVTDSTPAIRAPRSDADASLAPASTNRSTPVSSTRSKNSSTRRSTVERRRCR